MASKSKKQKNILSAFVLVPVVEQVLQDREVECACSFEKNLYVGTTDGLVLYYGLVEGQTPLGKPVYQSKLKGRKQLDSDRKKSIQQLTVVPAIGRLLALVDGSLYLLDMYKLEIIDPRERINKVTCFCINESKSAQQPYSTEIVLAQQKKKSLHVYNLSNDRFSAVKEIPMSDLPVAMARDGDNVCVALSTQHFNAGRYSLVNIKESKDAIDLPSFPLGSTPIVKRTAKDQFLISTGDIGVIVSSSGESDRPPIPWTSSSDPSAAALVFPYLLTFSKSKHIVSVYSLLDQQIVQEIPFANGRYFSSSHGKLVAALASSIYLLVRVPLKEQVSQLLEQQYVDEAILLAETVAAVDEVKDQDSAYRYLCDVKERAAFIYFTQAQFSRMESALEESSTDPREVISKFDGLMIKSSSFIPQRDIPSAQTLGSAGLFSLKEAKKFLIRYLKDVRLSQLAIGIREEIDTALVKMLAEDQPGSVASYISHNELCMDFEETKTSLAANSCHYALALLYDFNGHTDAMMKVCTEIYDGKRVDESFPGMEYIVRFLRSCKNKDTLHKYSRWALDRDETKGVTIFIEEPEQRVLSPSAVLELLAPYNTATLMYLEYLINVKNSEEEVYHTRLGSLYLEKVFLLKEQGNDSVQLKERRQKLKLFLESSTHYRASFLLNRVQDTDLHQECAILYGRMEEHQKALTLLAHELRDYEKAEQYCSLYSKGRSRQYCQNLYQTLLAVYLRPSDSSKPPVIKPALRLLNTQGANFDASKVLQLLPPQWDISTVKEFLLRSLRNTTHTTRTVKIEHSLAKGENLQTRYELMQLQKGQAVISENKVCPVCQLPFTDATAIARYPNGTVTHLKCGRNKTICPITGTWFGE